MKATKKRTTPKNRKSEAIIEIDSLILDLAFLTGPITEHRIKRLEEAIKLRKEILD